MKLSGKLASSFAIPVLTRKRIWFAYVVAVLTDALQLLFGPLGWVVVDQALDVLAMILTSAALGFHFLLLPTFIVELIPLADMLPTWTGCTAAVIMLRKRADQQAPRLMESPPSPPVLTAPPPLIAPPVTPGGEPPKH